VPIRWAYLKRVLAGAIFGLYMAHLLYFLNPQVDITPGRLATVTLVYGITCGLLFGTALWLLRVLRVRVFGRPETPRSHGFGFVVLAAFISSAIYWIHLEMVVRIFLPVGAVRVLSKATNVITLTAFVLLAIWVLERNANRRVSRALFLAGVVVIAVSSVFLYQRRDSYRTVKQTLVVADIGQVAGQRPVIVAVVRNLPYDWIVTMEGEASLPFFEQARDHAFFTRMEPFPTTSPKSLWASLATGKLPSRHGVTGRFSYRTPLNRDPQDRFLLLPSGVGFRAWGLIPPVQRISAALPSGDALPLWTMFERLSLHASVVGWPSAPASGASAVITDRMIDAMRVPDPPELASIAPRFNGTGAARNAVLDALRRDLAAAGAARNAIASGRYELNVVALQGFETAQRALHIGTNDLPPKTSTRGEAIRAYVEQLDRTLGGLARAFPDHLLLVVSPSGPVPPAPPATVWAIVRDLANVDDPGADDGFVVITGPGATHKDNPASAYEVDVVPTVLFAAGLPVGRDMDGRVLIDAFGEDFIRRSTLSVIQTYEAREIVTRRGP
jgi:Type I phosphodiesterase / nucleotide pyrophosphatase